VVQLLGGALQCLVDCRYAFTTAVMERYSMRSNQLSIEVGAKLSKILLKILQAQGRDQLPPVKWLQKDSVVDYETDVAEMKGLYSRLAKKVAASDSSLAKSPSSTGACVSDDMSVSLR
jgi:hypothetical protein